MQVEDGPANTLYLQDAVLTVRSRILLLHELMPDFLLPCTSPVLKSNCASLNRHRLISEEVAYSPSMLRRAESDMSLQQHRNKTAKGKFSLHHA